MPDPLVFVIVPDGEAIAHREATRRSVGGAPEQRSFSGRTGAAAAHDLGRNGDAVVEESEARDAVADDEVEALRLPPTEEGESHLSRAFDDRFLEGRSRADVKINSAVAVEVTEGD